MDANDIVLVVLVVVDDRAEQGLSARPNESRRARITCTHSRAYSDRLSLSHRITINIHSFN